MTHRVGGATCVASLVLLLAACVQSSAMSGACGTRSGELVSAARRSGSREASYPLSVGIGQFDAQWPNEPGGLTVVSDAPFHTLNANGWRGERRQTTNGSGLAVTVDSTAPIAPRALTFRYAAGYEGGSEPGVEYFHLPTPTRETYFGFWWKASSPWQPHPSGVNKIAFLFPRTASTGSMYIMMFYDANGYTLQVEPTFLSDTRRLVPNVVATPIALGQWHRIEWYSIYSTGPDSHDGAVKWWLDGVLQGAYTDLQMPDDSGFAEYTIAPTWGGVGGVKGENDCFWYQHAHISVR